MGKKTKTVYGLLLALFVLAIAPALGLAYGAEATLKDGANYPGVFYVTAEKGASGVELGIPLLDKNTTLKDNPTTLSPAIVMGAAVPYEERTGFTEFTKKPGGNLYPPYEYFRYKIIDEPNPGGDGGTHKKMSGFDGSYVIVRVDISKLISGLTETQLNKSYLHVLHEGNKALMPAEINVDWNDTNGYAYFTDTMNGTQARVYSLANKAAALKDKSGNDAETPYVDLIIYSSGTLVAGAETGAADAKIKADYNFKIYVDQTKDYDPKLKYDAASTDPDHAKKMLAKYYNEEKAKEAVSDTVFNSYLVKGGDLELEVMVPQSTKTEYWSLRKALNYSAYNYVDVKMICEVPVLEGLTVNGGYHAIFDVNSFDIQIANHQTTGAAALTIESGSTLTIKDGFKTTGAELAVGNNASLVVKSGGKMIIDESCQLEVEYDAASTAAGAAPKDYDVGVITIEAGGIIENRGVISVEGKEGKPQGTQTNEKNAEFHIQGTLDNYGCLLSYGTLYNEGTIINRPEAKYGRTIVSQDPDKGSFTYHRGIQISWKDDVTQKSKGEAADGSTGGSPMGHLYNGLKKDGTEVPTAVIQNSGDIVFVPGIFENYGVLANEAGGNVYLCAVTEAVIPVTPSVDQPTVAEKRVHFSEPIPSSFYNYTKVDSPSSPLFGIQNKGTIAVADVKIVNNGRTGALTPIDEKHELFKQIMPYNYGAFTNSGTVKVATVYNGGYIDNGGKIGNRIIFTKTFNTISHEIHDASKEINVFNGVAEVLEAKNIWRYAPATDLSLTPAMQDSYGAEMVTWTAKVPGPEGAQYLLVLFDGLGGDSEYPLEANKETELKSPTLPKENDKYVVYDALLYGGGVDGVMHDMVTVHVTNESVVVPPVPVEALEYTGLEQTLTSEAFINGQPAQYRLNDATEWTDTVPKGIEAGEYTVHYKPKNAETGNDEAFPPVKVTIAERNITVTADDASGLLADPTIQATWTVSGLPENGKKIADGDISAVRAATAGTDGTYPIEVTIQNETNYPSYNFIKKNGTFTVASFKIVAKDVHGIWQDPPTDSGTPAYSGYNIFLSVNEIVDNGSNTLPDGVTVHYSSDTELTKDNYSIAPTSATFTKPAGAGTHTVYYYAVKGEGDAAVAVKGSKQVIIDKAKQDPPKTTTTESTTAGELYTKPESCLNRGNGYICNLTLNMEYRNKLKDVKYTKVDAQQEPYDKMLPAGTYLVRKEADDNHYASPDAEVVIKQGDPITVTFNSNCGTPVDSVKNLVYGQLVTQPADNPELDGATFKGWYVANYTEGEARYKKFDFAGTQMVGDLELLAGWELTAASTVTLPEKTTKINASAFAGAEKIVSVSIPYGCTDIGENAFQNCKGLSRIQIPASVTVIEPTAFDGCKDVIVFVLNKEAADLTKASAAETFFKGKTGFAFVIPVE